MVAPMEWQPPVAPGPPPPPAPEAPAPSPPQPRWALARWSERVGATILDSIFLILLIVVPVAAGAGLGAATDELAGIPFYAAAAVVWLFYAPYLMRREGERNGQTWGKQAVGIRVVKEDGQPMTFGWSFFREFLIKTVLFGWVGGSLVIGWLLDVLWPLWDGENRALHDMIVATRVVQA
jgi:uncharacterized RDD family membrane protein YckC